MFPNIWDHVSPKVFSPMAVFCDSLTSTTNGAKNGINKYVVSVGVGKHYEMKDILIMMEGNKLRISGKTKEILKNGFNEHKFQREYEIPENVDTKTMSSKLSKDGTLHVIFLKKGGEFLEDIQYFNTPHEFKIKINTKEFIVEEISIRIVGKDLILEATRKSSTFGDNGTSKSVTSGYMSRSIRLDEDVDVDQIKAVEMDNWIEISAPRNTLYRMKIEKTLKIEKQKINH